MIKTESEIQEFINEEIECKNEESKVKVTLKEVCDSMGTLFEIRDMNINREINYWCLKNLNILAQDYNFYIRERNDICKRYCLKDENGDYYTIEDNYYKFNLKEECDVSNFDDEFNALLNFECYIKPFVMSVDVLESFPNVSLKKGSVDMIYYMLP